MIEKRLALLHEIDHKAKEIALKAVNSHPITDKILMNIAALYSSAQL
jgi:hypothetical protein